MSRLLDNDPAGRGHGWARLDADASGLSWKHRHARIAVVLAAHVPALLAFGSVTGKVLLLAASVVTLVSWRWRDDERGATEVRLRTSEDNLRLTFEAAPIGMALVDLEGRFLRANPALGSILGFDAAELIGTTFQSITHPDDLELDLEQLRACLAGSIDGYEMEKRYIRPDGNEVWAQLNVALARDASDAPLHFVAQVMDITERLSAAASLAASEARFAHQATHDALTGLPNRVLLEDRIVQARAAADRHDELLAALYIDVDNFKDVNDSHGHGVGDLLLAEVATRLRSAARVEDTVARLGGDEFVVVAGVADTAAAAGLAARACAAFEAPFELKDLTLHVSGSVGLATTRSATIDLLEAADTALYEAKARGRARWVAYADDMARLERRDDRGREASPSGPELPPMSEQQRVDARYRAHVAESTQALVVHNDGLIVAVSPLTVKLLDAGGEDALLRRHVFEFVTAESLSSAHSRYDSVIDGGWPQPDIFEIATLSGLRMAVEVTSTPVLWDGVFASQLTLRPAPTAQAVTGPDGAPPADLLDELALGIPAGQLVVAYQPIIDADGSPAKVEALVRWQHPERGLLLPGAFVPAAERSPLIGALTAEVLRQSCAQVAAWRRAGAPDLELAVNISGRELGDHSLVRRVVDALDSSGLPASALWLEVTETAVAHDSRLATEEIETLSALGVRFALDDFGTGFATLAQLRRFPAHALKIDRLFVDGVTSDDGGDVAIVRSVLALGRELGLAVIAEGVETEAQREALSRLGCELYQGYLFAPPSPADPPPPWLPAFCDAASMALG